MSLGPFTSYSGLQEFYSLATQYFKENNIDIDLKGFHFIVNQEDFKMDLIVSRNTLFDNRKFRDQFRDMWLGDISKWDLFFIDALMIILLKMDVSFEWPSRINFSGEGGYRTYLYQLQNNQPHYKKW